MRVMSASSCEHGEKGMRHAELPICLPIKSTATPTFETKWAQDFRRNRNIVSAVSNTRPQSLSPMSAERYDPEWMELLTAANA